MNNIPDNMKRIGIAADHAGFELKEHIKKMLIETGYELIDFGNSELNPLDDYPDYVIPLAKAIASGNITLGIAICGSGVGACIAANKVAGVGACLIHEGFSARQGVEDDDMNLICLGGRVVDKLLAWELITIFLTAKFIPLERHVRRLEKIYQLETIQKLKL
jgi:ribose 5-phosphate isomerase B